jgi:hypothetical protein
MTLNEIGYVMAQAAKLAGGFGIGRRPAGEAVVARMQALMDARLAEYREQDQNGR